MLTAAAVFLTVLVLAGAFLRPWYAREFGLDLRPSIPWALWAGVAAWALCHLAAAAAVLRGGERLVELGPNVTTKDQFYIAWQAVGESWWGTALLVLCLVAAGALTLSRRGKGGRAFILLVLVVVLPVIFSSRNLSFAPGPQPPGPAGDSYVPEEARIISTDGPSEPWVSMKPLLQLLMIPAAVVVLLGSASALRAARRKRPWPCPPTDALLLIGIAASVCIGVLHIQAAFQERASIAISLGPKAPPVPELTGDFLRAAVPGALLAWAGGAVVTFGLLDRWRRRPGAPAAP